jgi:uncharacterized metal-binding protein YceD (DUF177 family)
VSAEFSRPIAAERIGAAETRIDVEANVEERQALAERMRVPALLALRCGFALRRETGAIRATAMLHARLTRECVVSLEEFETALDEDFALRFVPEGTESTEIDPEKDDEIPYANGTIDLGEAAAEQLALALDPYPRKPGAVLPEEAEAPTSPFAALDALRRRH